MSDFGRVPSGPEWPRMGRTQPTYSIGPPNPVLYLALGLGFDEADKNRTAAATNAFFWPALG